MGALLEGEVSVPEEEVDGPEEKKREERQYAKGDERDAIFFRARNEDEKENKDDERGVAAAAVARRDTRADAHRLDTWDTSADTDGELVTTEG